jgi:exopolyphosphatase / guanosine-5'-triphosphate,3'-diphosphate pyrophosphatase
LLVLGYMQALHINQINVVSVNNADGALTNPPYWQ